MARKRKPLPPRRKRMKREARLQAARAWLEDFNGKDVIRSYARWFAVDWLCAIKELRLLGVPLSETRVRQLEETLNDRRRGSGRPRLESAEGATEPFEALPEERGATPGVKQRPSIEVVFDYEIADSDDDVPF